MAKKSVDRVTAKPRKRRSAFVPRLLVPAAIVGVIPACVVAACGGNVVVADSTSAASSGNAANATSSSSSSTGFFVAAVAYPAYEGGAG